MTEPSVKFEQHRKIYDRESTEKYLQRLFHGCLMHALIGTQKTPGILSKAVQGILDNFRENVLSQQEKKSYRGNARDCRFDRS